MLDIVFSVPVMLSPCAVAAVVVMMYYVYPRPLVQGYQLWVQRAVTTCSCTCGNVHVRCMLKPHAIVKGCFEPSIIFIVVSSHLSTWAERIYQNNRVFKVLLASDTANFTASAMAKPQTPPKILCSHYPSLVNKVAFISRLVVLASGLNTLATCKVVKVAVDVQGSRAVHASPRRAARSCSRHSLYSIQFQQRCQRTV